MNWLFNSPRLNAIYVSFFKVQNALSKDNAIELSDNDLAQMGIVKNMMAIPLQDFFSAYYVKKTENNKYWLDLDANISMVKISKVVRTIVLFIGVIMLAYLIFILVK